MTTLSNFLRSHPYVLAIAIFLLIPVPAQGQGNMLQSFQSSISSGKCGLHLQLRISEAKRKTEDRNYYRSITRQRKIKF